MFEQLPRLSGDPILELMSKYKVDTREDKIDVGIGVFKDDSGQTPIMQAVTLAEQRLLESQATKSYLGMVGNVSFNNAMLELIFENNFDKSRTTVVQTPGGSGALKICAEMLAKLTNKTLWVSDPTWGNHAPIFESSGLTVKTYPYLDRNSKKVDEEKMLEALAKLGKNDVVLLHGCCHNPTGANLSNEAWDSIADLVVEKGFLPFVDLAYQGFGDSLTDDVYGVRKLANTVPELIVTNSCSKNFGLYRDRVGCAIVMGENSEHAKLIEGQLNTATRVTYSMPPDHGASVVSIILNDADLRSNWENELTAMRNRVLTIRQTLSSQLSTLTQSNKWDFIAEHRGMFSLLCLDKAVTDKLVDEHGIYIVAGGRVNIAGLKSDEQITRFAACLAEVTQKI